MKRLVLITALLCASAPAQAGENCTCRYKGQDIGEGRTVCLATPNGPQMARCERVLNNTSWKFLGNSCPYASMEQIKPYSVANPEIFSTLKTRNLKKSVTGKLKI